MARQHKLVIVMILICLVLPGCYDATEVDEEVYALAIGVDKGVSNAIRITFQYATYQDSGGGMNGGGGGGSESEESGEVTGTIVSTVEAASLLEGINLMNAAVNRQISLMHVKMLVFSEEYAREGVAKYVEPLARFRELREFMRVVVCKGQASDFIKENKTFIGSNPSKAMELMFEQSKNSGYYPDTMFNDFYIAMVTPYGQATAIYAGVNDFNAIDSSNEDDAPVVTPQDIEPGLIPRKGGTKKEFFGTALFNGDSMVGSLSQNETRYFLMAIGEFRRGFFTFDDPNEPGYICVLDLQPARPPKVRAVFADGVPVINLRLMIDADVLSIQSRKHYEKLENIEEFSNTIARQIEENLIKTIKKTQALNTDIFHFGKKVARNFRTIDEMEQYNWLMNYKDARINVEVELHVRRSGYIFGAEPIRTIDSKMGEEEHQ